MAIIQTPSIAAVVEDQTPQLGGNLDCQDYQLQWSGSSQYIGSTILGAGLTVSSGSNNLTLSSNGNLSINTNSAERAIFQSSGGLSVGGAVAPLSVDSFYDLGTTSLRWNTVYADSLTIGDGVDAVLTADAANELALRNGTNAQKMSVYNTWTDGANNEALSIGWDTNVAKISTEAAGTGAARDLQLIGSDSYLTLGNSSSMRVAGSLTMTWGSSLTRTYNAFVPSSDSLLVNGSASARWATTYTDGIATDVETFTAASDTLDAKNNVALCDCTSNNITINLPAASTASGLQYHIKKIDSTANTVTVDGNGAETIDGATTQVISSQYDSMTIVSDGSNWFIL